MLPLVLHVLSLVASIHALSPRRNTVTIAPGVEMPLLNFGLCNHTLSIEAGGRGLDTALVYGDEANRETGQAVIKSGLNRSELFVTTKVPCCPTRWPAPYAPWPGVTCKGGARNPAADLQHTLDHIGLDYVDLVIMHWPCDSIEDTLITYNHMEKMVAAGRARAVGVSNFNATMLDALAARASTKPAINQVGFSVGGHAPGLTPWGRDDATLAKCRELGVTLSAYSPLGGWSKVDVLHDPAVLAVAKSQGRNAAQVALRWIVQQGTMLSQPFRRSQRKSRV